MDIRASKDRIDARNADLSGSAFDDVNLSASEFNNIDLSGTTFDDVNMTGVAFRNIDRTGMTIDGVSVEALFAAYEART